MKSKVFRIILSIIVILGLVRIGKYVYLMPKFSSGEEIPGFEAKLKDGSSFALSDLKGDYVLLDFWGSWCGPCRRDNPGLVRLYDEFNGKSFKEADDFHIVNVAIETNERRWLAAIDKDGLNWPYHIAEFDRFNSPIAKAYGVREIPTKYLLDSSGKIIGVNQTEEELRDFFNSQIK